MLLDSIIILWVVDLSVKVRKKYGLKKLHVDPLSVKTIKNKFIITEIDHDWEKTSVITR